MNIIIKLLLLSFIVSLNAMDLNNCLIDAIKANNTEQAQKLLDQGADPSATDKKIKLHLLC